MNINKKDRKVDWLPRIKKKSEASFWIGMVLLVFAGVGIGYIGSKRISYANEFYTLSFSINFLEDIRPGTKVRYQGGVIVGEITTIESGYQEHIAHAKIKKEFLVPKNNSHISLKTWGYFGGKFVNIEIIHDYIHGETYDEYSILKVEEVKNSAIVMNEIQNIFMKPDMTALSPLENKLTEVKAMTKYVAGIPYIQPKTMRSIIGSGAKKYREYVMEFKDFSIMFFENAEKFSETTKIVLNMINTRTTEYSKPVMNIKNNLFYENYSTVQGYTNLWHDEDAYYYARAFSEYVKDKSVYFKNNPYQLIYRD
ncbi:MAG: MCE family protein [Spirochaetia bacterium]|nr:MCE family protein [Spirochaetia bacterium]